MRFLFLIPLAVAAIVLGLASNAGERAVATSPGAAGKIAFGSDRGGNQDVYVMNANGSGVQRLTDHAAPDSQPKWSPDGTQIAFTSLRDGDAEVYIMNADGSAERRITNSAGNNASPTWSPDGRRLTFDGDRGGNYEVYVINVDGSGERNLSNNPGSGDSFPTWSPDGTKIVFESERNGSFDLFSMNTDGSGQTFLYGSSADEFRSDFSPDGSKITFTSGTGEAYDIWTVNADGTGARRITSNAALDAASSWTADGAEILFTSERGGNVDLYRVKPDGTGETRVTSEGAEDSQASSQPLTCTVAVVTSGETFSCTDGRSVRMLQVDAPNPGECGGDWAKAALQFIFLTPGRVVGLQYDTTRTDGGSDLAAPIWIGSDGAPYNLSIVMVYVGLAKAANVGAGNGQLQAWASASQGWAQAAQWNMWAPGKPFTGGC